MGREDKEENERGPPGHHRLNGSSSPVLTPLSLSVAVVKAVAELKIERSLAVAHC